MRRRSSRVAFHLIELMLAVALAAGPMLVALQLVHSNTSGARYNQDRATARMVLVDLVEVLAGESLDRLRELSQTTDPRRIDAVIEQRIAAIPPQARQQYKDQLSILLGRCRMKLDEDLGADVPGLVNITLEAAMEWGAVIRINRLFRPGARQAG